MVLIELTSTFECFTILKLTRVIKRVGGLVESRTSLATSLDVLDWGAKSWDRYIGRSFTCFMLGKGISSCKSGLD